MPVTRLGNNKFLPGIGNFLPGNAKIPLGIVKKPLGNDNSALGIGNSDPGNAVSHPGIGNSEPGESISDPGKPISALEKRLSEAAFLRQYAIALSFLRASHMGRRLAPKMHKLFLKIADKLRMPYDPSPLRREEVIRFLSQRPTLTHEEWHRRFAPDIPIEFVRWFRDACSQYFEYDLAAALPEDRLVEDLGMYDATFSDVDMDIFEDYEARYHTTGPVPDDGQARITTFGEFLNALWLHAQHTRGSRA